MLRLTAAEQGVLERSPPGVGVRVVDAEPPGEFPVAPGDAAAFRLIAHEPRPVDARGHVRLVVGAELPKEHRVVPGVRPGFGLVDRRQGRRLLAGVAAGHARGQHRRHPLRALMGEREGRVIVERHDQIRVIGHAQGGEVEVRGADDDDAGRIAPPDCVQRPRREVVPL